MISSFLISGFWLSGIFSFSLISSLLFSLFSKLILFSLEIIKEFNSVNLLFSLFTSVFLSFKLLSGFKFELFSLIIDSTISFSLNGFIFWFWLSSNFGIPTDIISENCILFPFSSLLFFSSSLTSVFSLTNKLDFGLLTLKSLDVFGKTGLDLIFFSFGNTADCELFEFIKFNPGNNDELTPPSSFFCLLSNNELNGLPWLVNIGLTCISFTLLSNQLLFVLPSSAKGDDIFVSLLTILIFIRLILLSLVSKLSLESILLLIFWLILNNFGSSILKGFLGLFNDVTCIGKGLLLLAFEFSLDIFPLIFMNILGLLCVFFEDSALYIVPSFIISFNVCWGFGFSSLLSWAPNTAEGISEFWDVVLLSGIVFVIIVVVVIVFLDWGIKEVLFFKNISCALSLFSNIESIFLSGKKLMLLSSILFWLFVSLLNNFCSKIDELPLFSVELLSNKFLVNIGILSSFISSFLSLFSSLFSSFFSSTISIFSSSCISPGSISISFFLFSLFSLSLFSTYPNLTISSTNFISFSFFGIISISFLSFFSSGICLKPKLILTLFSSLFFPSSFSFFVSIVILIPCSLDLSAESLILELLILFWFWFIAELFTPKVTLESVRQEL